MTRLCVVLVAALCGAACGGGGGDQPDAAPFYDAPPVVQEDHDYVVARVVLPTTQEEVDDSSFVLPGTGDRAVNKLGGLLVVMIGLLEGVPVQAEIEANLVAGLSRQVLRFTVASLGTADGMPFVTWNDAIDDDEPPDPADDLGGMGVFRLRGTQDLVPGYDRGAIDQAGNLSADGPTRAVVFELPVIAGQPPDRIDIDHPWITITLTATDAVGAFGGAITPETLQTDVYPTVAALLTRAIAEMAPMHATISSLFDADMDGVITVPELITNSTLMSLATPDVDLDSDGAFEHISVGVLVEMKPCTLLTR